MPLPAAAPSGAKGASGAKGLSAHLTELVQRNIAEALAESIDWEATAGEIKRLQNEWKAIGPVKKSRSEAMWQRFRGAEPAAAAFWTGQVSTN